MKKSLLISLMLSTVLVLHWAPMEAQETEKVHWLSFEELEDALNIKPKKVFISFTTDWCTYCRKMDKVVFTKPEVIERLNTDYYAVHFDAEYDSVVTFGERQYINDQLEKSRTPIHQIAQLLALREGQFVAPTIVILDEDFKLIARYFEYLDSRRLLEALEQ